MSTSTANPDIKELTVEPSFFGGVQVGWAVWPRPPEEYRTWYYRNAWRRALGVGLLRGHLAEGHSLILGWLRDYEETPRVKSVGANRAYFQSVMCVDCKHLYAAINDRL